MPLSCDHIAFSYADAAHPLFSGVSFRLAAPGFHAFFGPSGVGKTSLAGIITGSIDRYSGTVGSAGLKSLLYTCNTERLPGWSSVGRHLTRVVPPAMLTRKDELVETFGLADCIDSRFNRLSMGQRNRVNLIRYLLQDCDLLIMDESLANVDELTREKIILAVKAIFPERYFIYISHNIIEVAKFCDSILVFRGPGKTPQTVMVRGRNLQSGETLSRSALDATLLEIMNAA